jgi:hypothetical protein
MGRRLAGVGVFAKTSPRKDNINNGKKEKNNFKNDSITGCF